MKKLFFLPALLILSLFFSVEQGYSQLDTAPILIALETQTGINSSEHQTTLLRIRGVSQQITDLDSTIEENNKLLEKILKIMEREEQDLLEVPAYIQNSGTMSGINRSEANILQQLQQLQSIASQLNNVNINHIIQPLLGMLSSDMGLAQAISQHNVLRMPPIERSNYLRQIQSRTNSTEMRINQVISELQRLINSNVKREDQTIQFQNLMNSQIIPIFN